MKTTSNPMSGRLIARLLLLNQLALLLPSNYQVPIERFVTTATPAIKRETNRPLAAGRQLVGSVLASAASSTGSAGEAPSGSAAASAHSSMAPTTTNRAPIDPERVAEPNSGLAPKLIPLSALDRYQEGADLRLFCSAASGSPRLSFEWRKNQLELLSSLAAADGDQPEPARQRHLLISMMDDSSSVLRIKRLEADDAGNYTCLARNQHGFDSSSVRINVNG